MYIYIYVYYVWKEKQFFQLLNLNDKHWNIVYNDYIYIYI